MHGQISELKNNSSEDAFWIDTHIPTNVLQKLGIGAATDDDLTDPNQNPGIDRVDRGKGLTFTKLDLKTLLEEGQIDGLTKIKTSENDEWRSLCDDLTLKCLFSVQCDDEDASLNVWSKIDYVESNHRIVDRLETDELFESRELDSAESDFQELLLESSQVPISSFADPTIGNMSFEATQNENQGTDNMPELIKELSQSNASKYTSREEYENLRIVESQSDVGDKVMLNDTMDDISAEASPNTATSFTEGHMKREHNRERRKQYKERQKLKKQKGEWIAAKSISNVYVTGLPENVTFEELDTLFKRAGIMKVDPDTMLSKIRIYRYDDGRCKGDALVCYANEASVELAIKYLHEYYIRPDCIISVQEATFEPSSESLKPIEMTQTEKDNLKKRKLAAKAEQQRQLSWGDDIGLTGLNSKKKSAPVMSIILRPLWSYEEANLYADDNCYIHSQFYDYIAKNVQNLCETMGKVQKVTAIKRHPLGIVCVKFGNCEDAEVAASTFQFRDVCSLGLGHDPNDLSKQIESYLHDGTVDLKIACVPQKESTMTEDDMRWKLRDSVKARHDATYLYYLSREHTIGMNDIAYKSVMMNRSIELDALLNRISKSVGATSVAYGIEEDTPISYTPDDN